MTASTLGVFDRYSWYFFIVWFGAALVLNLLEQPAGHMVAYGGIVLVLVNNLARLVIVAEQFKSSGNSKFRGLSYLLILVLLGAITIQYLVQGNK
jgi:hypothetical protein